MKYNYKKPLVAFSFYALALTSCSTVGSSMNMQKDSNRDISIKNKLTSEASRAYRDAAKAANDALAVFDAARAKARSSTPQGRAAAMAAVDAAEAELEAYRLTNVHLGRAANHIERVSHR